MTRIESLKGRAHFRFRAPRITWFILLATMIVSASCNRNLITATEAYRDDAGGEFDVALRYRVDPDPYGGENAVAYRLQIENRSDRKLSSCVLTIDNTYTASLSKLLTGGTGIPGALERGYDRLEPHSDVGFSLNHDVPNHALFVDAQGNSLPAGARIAQVTLDCDNAKFSWTIDSD